MLNPEVIRKSVWCLRVSGARALSEAVCAVQAPPQGGLPLVAARCSPTAPSAVHHTVLHPVQCTIQSCTQCSAPYSPAAAAVRAGICRLPVAGMTIHGQQTNTFLAPFASICLYKQAREMASYRIGGTGFARPAGLYSSSVPSGVQSKGWLT